MFLQKPSPFTLKAKSRIAEILLLRKYDAINISKSFPNVWRRIYNKSYHNLVSIKELTFKTIKRYYNTYFYNKENNTINISNLDATVYSKNSNKSEISRVIRKIKTHKSHNSLNNGKNGNKFLVLKNMKKYSSNKLGLESNNMRKVSDEISSNGINFSESFNSLNSISSKNKKSENSHAESNLSNEINNNNNNFKNSDIKNIGVTKFTFKNSTIKNINNINKDSLITNLNNNKFLKVNSKIDQNNKSINKDKSGDNSTEILSNYSNNTEFLILEDINTNFAKRIKKKMNKKNKIEKIKNLFEMQNLKYKNNLILLYTQFYNQIQNLNTNKINATQNLYNIIQKNFIEFSKPSSNKKLLSKLIESEDDSNLSTQRNSQFNIESLKEVSNESFEIKSSYENLNKLSKGEITNNEKYKSFLHLFIQNLNIKNNFEEEKINKIISKIFALFRNKDILDKDNIYIKSETQKNHNRNNENFLLESNASKSKKNFALTESITLNNQKYSFGKQKTSKTNDNLNINIYDKTIKRKKSKFHEKNLDKLEKIKFSSVNPQDKKLLSEIQELEKEENIYENKENENKSKYINATKGQKIYINKKLESNNNKNENENNNNIILTSSMNAINEFEKEEILKNKIEILNKKDNKIDKTNISNNSNNEKNNKCSIY